MERSIRRITAVVGTRPEMVKMAPVLTALARRERFATRVVFTGQHKELLQATAEFFDVRPDVDLALMAPGQSPATVVADASRALHRELLASPADLVLAQGDTATVLSAALAAFHAGVPFAHLEAGLRTGDLAAPFPEEGYRRMVGSIASLHFAPTARARRALLAEGVDPARVVLSGNTVVDALLATLARRPALPLELPRAARCVLATLHRRESFGAPLAGIVEGLSRMLEAHADVHLVVPVHPNPAVGLALAPLARHARAHLVPPLDYPSFVATLARAALVITDSGGVQEEAPPLGVPVLVARDSTERPEAVEAGCAELVGSDPAFIAARAAARLASPGVARISPFGDGRAAERVALALERHLEGRSVVEVEEVLPWAA